ncbi:MAG: class I SAM-dependent methyltransferase, partial [Smithella sp.]
DISADAIDIAKQEAAKQGLTGRINYRQADINTLRLIDSPQYDICFADSSLHHINNLEYVINQVSTSLRPGGLFIVKDYTGPSRFQWSDKIEALINRTLAIIPDYQRVNLLDGKTIKGTVRRPSIEEVIAVDPSEAIRSNEIVDILKSRFEVLYETNFGGTILQFMLADIIGNFRPDDPNHNAMLEFMILFEEVLLEEKIIENWFSFLVLRRP